MKNVISTIATCLLTSIGSFAQNEAIEGLLSRILPNNSDASKFEYNLEHEDADKDYFVVSCDGTKISVKGNNTISLAVGINWYLQHKAGVDISWNNPKGQLPATLPAMAEERHESKVDYRYYLNFCTHSYTMSFWGWDRWQQEIDWMALHGINLPLIIQGMECVWRELLINGYGYTSLDQVNEFVTGGAYYGWFFMNNMTQWGGPQPESWYEQQKNLGKKIFRRLHDFGMTPVIPGYVGMIPKKFLNYATKNTEGWTASQIVSSGKWNQFERPWFVNNANKLKEFAAQYYKAIDNVFGEDLSTHYYAIDPFHEGTVPSGVTPKTSINAMWEALQAYDPEAIWVAQHWQENPTTAIASDNKIASDFCTTLWRFDKEGYKTYIINAQTNFYIGNVDYGQLVTTARREWGRPYTFEGDGSGRWVAKDEQVTGNNYLNSFYANSNTTARNIGYWRDAFSDAGNVFLVKEVTTLPLSITNGWTTFAFPVNVLVPNDVEVYALTKVENSVASLKRLETGTILPAGSGYIAKAENGDHGFTVTTQTASPIENMLKGVCTYRTGLTPKSVYTISTDVSATATLNLSTSTSIAKNTSILPKDATPEASNTILLEMVPTDIETTNVESEKTQEHYYDLTGRPITKKQGKGIVVAHGKKFVAR